MLTIEQNSPAVGNEDALVQDVGIRVRLNEFQPLLQKGCPTPCSATYTFSTSEDNQDQIKLYFYRGIGRALTGLHFLGGYQIAGIRPASGGEPNVELTVTASTDGIALSARDADTGQTYSIVPLEE
jgi:molecular chaperone DnaK (HSP70)